MFTELAELVTFPLSQGSSTQYDNRFYYFSVFIPRRYKDVYVNSFFPCVARLCNEQIPIKKKKKKSFKFLVHQCSMYGVNLSEQFMFKNF